MLIIQPFVKNQNIHHDENSLNCQKNSNKIHTAALSAYLNKALDAEPPIASFLKSMLIGGGPFNAAVIWIGNMKLRIRITLRDLLVLMVLAAIPCWCVSSEISQFQTEKAALAQMQTVNPRMSVVWENQTPDWIAAIGIQPQWMNRIMRLDATGVTCGELKGEDYPKSQIEFNDEDLADIAIEIDKLEGLREVYFQVTKLSDQSIDYLATLTQVRILNLQETDVTPEGAQRLKGKLSSNSVQYHPRSR